MRDERERRRAQRRALKLLNARDRYDRRVRQAICSAEWTARWSAHAASLSPNASRGGIATARIRMRNPRPRLLSSLARLGRLLGEDGNWHLATRWLGVDSPFVLERSGKTTVRVLSTVLEGEAEFEALVIHSLD